MRDDVFSTRLSRGSGSVAETGSLQFGNGSLFGFPRRCFGFTFKFLRRMQEFELFPVTLPFSRRSSGVVPEVYGRYSLRVNRFEVVWTIF